MLHFTRHYIDTLQEMLLSLMLFCGKFIKVYVCQKLLKYSLVWQTYGKNKTVQFFCLTVYLELLPTVFECCMLLHSDIFEKYSWLVLAVVKQFWLNDYDFCHWVEKTVFAGKNYFYRDGFFHGKNGFFHSVAKTCQPCCKWFKFRVFWCTNKASTKTMIRQFPLKFSETPNDKHTAQIKKVLNCKNGTRHYLDTEFDADM